MEEYFQDLQKLLESEFKNGVRPHSVIDQNKIRRSFRLRFDKDLPADFDFVRVLPLLGIVQGGKVFPMPSAQEGGWLEFLLGLMAQGNRLLWFSRVMELHADEMIKMGIASAEMLREVMVQSASDKFEIAVNRFAPKGVSLEVAQIVQEKIPGNVVLFSESELHEQLPYVDAEVLHGILKDSPAFMKNGFDSYAVVECVELDEGEVCNAVARVKDGVGQDGYFPLAQLDLPESAALNDPGLSMGVLRKVLFARYLDGDFTLYFQIVSRRGKVVDGRIPLRLFCREHSEVTLARADELAGEYNISAYLVVLTLHEEMVRVERERFVSPTLVTFEVDVIDTVLSEICACPVTPLVGIRNFADFPAVPGLSWNIYLLEAFLRRASKRFKLLTVSAAPKDISGVIVRRDGGFDDAVEAIAAYTVHSNIPDEEEQVGSFLLQSGCVLRRRSNLVQMVVGRMRDLLGAQ